MMWLRTKYGVDNQILQSLIGLKYQEIFDIQGLKRLEDRGLLVLTEDSIITTTRGLSVLNSLLPSILNLSMLDVNSEM